MNVVDAINSLNEDNSKFEDIIDHTRTVALHEAIRRNTYHGVVVGSNEYLISLSHLQYVDDTIFLGKWSNARNLTRILKCFELVLGLKFNLQKNYMFGVVVSQNAANGLVAHLCCGVGLFPFTYLGLPICTNMNKVRTWYPLSKNSKTIELVGKENWSSLAVD